MPSYLKKNALLLFNWLVFILFLFICFISLNAKFIVVSKLTDGYDFFTLLDIFRSEISFSMAILSWLAIGIVFRIGKIQSLINLLLVFLLSFYILKLTGLYIITHDATPYAMIEYGAYLFNNLFFSTRSAFIFFIVAPTLLFFTNLLFFVIQDIEEKDNLLHSRKFIFSSIAVFLLFAFIPPIQNKLSPSIAYHPYVFTFSNFIYQKEKPLIERPSPIEHVRIASDLPERSNPQSKNIVIIILESVRYDAIREEISPYMQQLKKQSLFFEHSYAVIPHTSKALVAIHCGFSPFLSPYLFESSFGIPHDCLPDTLKKMNYHSVFFQSPTRHFENREKLIKKIGFDAFFSLEDMDKTGFELVNYFGYEDNILLPKSKQWLEQQARQETQPFLAVYLTGSSHHNYHTPSRFEKKHYAENKSYNRYLNSVNYTDSFVEQLITLYKEAGFYQNTLFVIVSDHGEGFGEHKPMLHNNNIYNTGLRIPFLIYAPDLAPQHFRQTFSQADIQNILLHLIENKPVSDIKPLQEQVLSACWYGNYCYSLILNSGNARYKFITHPVDNISALYELNFDPNEQDNLIDKNPVMAKKMEALLLGRINHDYQYYYSWYYQQDQRFLKKVRDTFSPFHRPE